MPITPEDVNQLQNYAAGVMKRADHHAGQVKGVALALFGGIIWRAQPGSIRIRSFNDSPANMLWADIGPKTYVFAYNHADGTIEIRDRTQNGAVLHALDDTIDLQTLHATIAGL